jgi:hypothetical protein
MVAMTTEECAKGIASVGNRIYRCASQCLEVYLFYLIDS